MKPYLLYQMVTNQRPIEIISYPFIDKEVLKVMVRMVPKEPTTMREIEASRLELSQDFTGRKRMYVHHGLVEGEGWFPKDMLRYDHCWFYNQHDEESEGRMKGTINVYQLSVKRYPTWHPERWGSFRHWAFKALHTVEIS